MSFKEGDDVYVFYRMAKRCMPQRKYLATLDPRQGSYRPRIGMSDGWVPARVVGTDTKAGSVKVEYRWPNFFTMRGHMADPESGWCEWYSIADVCAASTASPDRQALRAFPRDDAPELALITFRWGGLNEVIPPGQWGETGSSVSDLFIDSFIDYAVAPELKNGFEVWTVYIEDHTDMLRIADAANLIFGPTHPIRRARHVGAMYHLYPTGFEENCIPNRETGQDGGAALVNQKSLFNLIQAMERTGVPTRFPHPSGFYELLTSKRWTYMMSSAPQFRVPPTVSLPRMLIEQNCGLAAKRAVEGLEQVKKLQARLMNEPEPKDRITKGVAKLGFSWEALDVKFWEEEKGLEDAIFQLTQAIEISQEITGQPHDLEAIIIQEYCKHDIEARFYVVEGKVEAIIYTKFCRIKENLEFGDFKELFSKKEAAEEWMGGDMAAMESGEQQCRELVARWMTWVQAQICDVPPAIRFDFFVGRGAKEGDEAVVWTLEICELGFSMLGEKELPTKVFQAMLRSCLGAASASIDAAAGAIKDAPTSHVAAAGAPVANGTSKEEPEPVRTSSGPVAKGGKKVGQANAPSTAAAAVAPSGAADGDTPTTLTITMGKLPRGGTQDQQQCAGVYTLMPDIEANCRPVWSHSRGDRFLYHGNDEYWYVGDEEEQELNFDCNQGYIRHEDNGAALPHELSGPWERGPEWTPDMNVFASLDGKRLAELDQAPTKGKGKSGGKQKGGGKSVGKG